MSAMCNSDGDRSDSSECVVVVAMSDSPVHLDGMLFSCMPVSKAFSILPLPMWPGLITGSGSWSCNAQQPTDGRCRHACRFSTTFAELALSGEFARQAPDRGTEWLELGRELARLLLNFAFGTHTASRARASSFSMSAMCNIDGDISGSPRRVVRASESPEYTDSSIFLGLFPSKASVALAVGGTSTQQVPARSTELLDIGRDFAKFLLGLGLTMHGDSPAKASSCSMKATCNSRGVILSMLHAVMCLWTIFSRACVGGAARSACCSWDTDKSPGIGVGVSRRSKSIWQGAPVSAFRGELCRLRTSSAAASTTALRTRARRALSSCTALATYCCNFPSAHPAWKMLRALPFRFAALPGDGLSAVVRTRDCAQSPVAWPTGMLRRVDCVLCLFRAIAVCASI